MHIKSNIFLFLTLFDQIQYGEDFEDQKKKNLKKKPKTMTVRSKNSQKVITNDPASCSWHPGGTALNIYHFTIALTFLGLLRFSIELNHNCHKLNCMKSKSNWKVSAPSESKIELNQKRFDLTALMTTLLSNRTDSTRWQGSRPTRRSTNGKTARYNSK
jgi:hypothetical protein